MKKKFFAVALATTMVASSAIPAMADTVSTDTETGLIGYYTFDDTLKNAIGEGSAKLHGGAGETWGAEAKGPETYGEGKNGKGYSFTGDGETKGEGLELDIKTNEAFTISLWVNTKQKINFQPIVFTNLDGANFISVATNYNDFASGALVLYKDWPHVNTVDGAAYWLDKNNSACVSEVTDLSTNTWTYVTLTMTKEGVASLYYNAQLLAESQTVAGYYKDMPIFLGINWWDASFAGTMDDVAVYDRALSAEDVAALYEKNGVPVEKNEPSTGEDETTTDKVDSPDTNNPDVEPTTPSNPSVEPTTPSNPSEDSSNPSVEQPTTSDSVTSDFDVTDADAEKVNKEAVVTGLPENVTLRVASIEKSSTDYNAIAEFVNKELKGKKVAAADLSLVKNGVAYAEQPNGKVKVTLPLFENIKDAKWIQVYRYDNAAKKFVEVDKVVEVKDGKFTFETDHFTPYLFASVNGPEEEPTTTAQPTTTGKTVTDTSNKPKTGDSAPIAVFAGMAAAGLAVFAVSKKRKNA